MRRIFGSDAVHRDDDDPFVPGEQDGSGRTRSMFDWTAVSHALMPTGFRDRAVAVSLETSKRRYEVGETVHFEVELRNRLPFPVSVRTESPVLWTWSVDGAVEAERTPPAHPERADVLRFSRSERKTFRRRWPQRIRDEDGRWLAVDRGEYTLAAWVNVGDPAGRRLRAETTVEIG